MTTKGRVLVRVRVTPRARGDALAVGSDGTLRVRLTALPVEGAANRALIDLLAKRLDLKRSDLEVARGSRGREKLVAVLGCSEAELRRRLDRLVEADVDKAKHGG